MNDTRSQLIMMMFALIPYAGVSWAYVALTNGSAKDFWIAFGILLAVRLFFSIIETLGSVLSWNVYGKKTLVERYVAYFRSKNFPPRKYADDDFLNYLARLDGDAQVAASVRASAKELEGGLVACEGIGILVGMRMHAAAEAALDVYSPRSAAPVFGESAV